jgi:SAM-dependent methyltransferase
MPRTGELTYFHQIGPEGRQHAVAKPFSDQNCGQFLMRVGELLRLLPPPPARLLECGCGTGWLAYLLAKHGYRVVATDVCPEAIQLARDNPTFQNGPAPDFRVADAEKLPFQGEFDAVLFFDALHHAVDELAAVESAYRALKPGGVCVLLEPGWGHHLESLEVEAKFGVTEKDMPPFYLKRLGKKVGFRACQVYPTFDHLGKALFPADRAKGGWRWRLLTLGPLKYLAALAIMVLGKRFRGVTVLSKAA